MKGPGTIEKRGRLEDLSGSRNRVSFSCKTLHNVHKDICWFTVSLEVEQTRDPQKDKDPGAHSRSCTDICTLVTFI